MRFSVVEIFKKIKSNSKVKVLLLIVTAKLQYFCGKNTIFRGKEDWHLMSILKKMVEYFSMKQQDHFFPVRKNSAVQQS